MVLVVCILKLRPKKITIILELFQPFPPPSSPPPSPQVLPASRGVCALGEGEKEVLLFSPSKNPVLHAN